MCEWTDCPSSGLDGVKADADVPHPLRTKMLSRPFIEQQPSTSSIQPLSPTELFQFVDKQNLLELAKGYTPTNTSRFTKWALEVFELWSHIIILKLHLSIRESGRSREAIRPVLKTFPFSESLELHATPKSPLRQLAMALAPD